MTTVLMTKTNQKGNHPIRVFTGVPSTSVNFARRDLSSVLLLVATIAKLTQVKARLTFTRSKSERTGRLRGISIVRQWITILNITTREDRLIS